MDPIPDTQPLSVSPSFQLTQLEQQIFSFLMEVQSKYFPEAVLRVAGGWVRDKLMGLNSHDIDIASNVQGRDLAEAVRLHLIEKGHGERTVGIIAANPKAGKHLECASIKVFGEFVDFVNLRSKAYTVHNPEEPIQIGLPQEDALQRDLTINALFFNINQNMIEDWTGTGIEDIKAGIIRTPVSPHQTFTDDPLRMLRAIRFSARYNFSLHSDVLKAIHHQVHELDTEIARERIGTELQGILSSKYCEQAVCVMASLGLFPVIFKCPPDCVLPLKFKENSLTGFINLFKILPVFSREFNCETNVTLLSILLLPFGRMYYVVKRKEIPVSHYVLADALKLPKKTTDTVVNLVEHHHEWTEILLSYIQTKALKFDRKKIGLLMRKTKEFYLLAMALAGAVLLEEHGIKLVLSGLTRLESHIKDGNLDGVWNLKPLLDGHGLMGLGFRKEAIGRANVLSIEWQIENPLATLAEYTVWVQTQL